jgi:hypothetical protein
MVRQALFDDLQMLHVTARDMLLSAFSPAIYGERTVRTTGLFQTVDTSRPVSLKTPVQCQLSMLTGKDWAIFRCFIALTIVPWNKTKPLNRNVNPRAFLIKVQGYLRLLVLTRIR